MKTWIAFGAALCAPVLVQAQGRAADLTQLYATLKAAETDDAASLVAERIWTAWQSAASPAAALLIQRGLRNMEAEAWGDAAADFTAAVDLSPDCVDAWYRRAQAYAGLGEIDNAMLDIQQVLRRDARHFAALDLLSRLNEERHDLPAALRALEAALEIYPRMENGRSRVEELRRKVHGQAL